MAGTRMYRADAQDDAKDDGESVHAVGLRPRIFTAAASAVSIFQEIYEVPAVSHGMACITARGENISAASIIAPYPSCSSSYKVKKLKDKFSP